MSDARARPAGRIAGATVGGRRAYDAARAGVELELKPRRVTVYGAELVSVDRALASWIVDLEVSKGTYVRSIARDLGRSLGCYAHVSELRRTFSGPVTQDVCLTLDELAEGGVDLVRERCLDPAATLGLAVRDLELGEIADVMNGRRIEPGTLRGGEKIEAGQRVALVFDGALVGIWHREGARLVCDSNFPQGIEGVR